MTLNSFKNTFTALPGSVNNRRHYGMGLCSCVRAKSTTHLSPPARGQAYASATSIILSL